MGYQFKHQPSQFVSEAKKNRDWYKQNLEFIMSHFNKRNDRTNRVRRTEDIENPIDEIVRLFTYYLGRQYNKDYYYTTQDQNNCDLPTVWINGQKITSLIDYMVGNAIKLIENIEPSVRATSKATTNKKTEALEMEMLKFDIPEFFELMEAYGISADFTGAQKEFETPEELYKYMEEDHQEKSEILAIKLAKDILLRNDFLNKYKQAFLYLLMGGYCGFKNRIENGKQYFDVVLPQNMIVDRSHDDDFLSEMRFVGEINWLSTGDIIERYQDFLTDEEIQEIGSLTSNNLYQLLDLTTHPYATTWAFTYNNIPTLAILEGYWIGMKDMGYEKSNDKFGNTHYSKIRKQRNGQYWTKTVYKGILIGNKYIVDAGEDTNIVRKHDNPGDVQMPIQVFMPNMVMGENRSIVSRLHKHQDRIDFITNEITKMMTRAKGKVYIINKQKLGTSEAKDVISDFERMGMHITDGSATGEDYVPGTESRLVETVDMTLDPNVQQLVSLRREEERIMEEIVNIPKVALGQQQGYVGAKTQAGTIAQSNLGTSYLYQGYIRFIEKHLSFAINQYKVSLMDDDGEDEIPVISERGREWIKITKDFQFEELNAYIKVRDFIDETGRERILMQAQAAMQNGMIDMIDYLKIEQAKTYTELINELEYQLKKKKRDQEKQQQLQQMMAQAQAQQQMNQQQEMEMLKEDNKNYREELKYNAQTGQAPPTADESELPQEII